MAKINPSNSVNQDLTGLTDNQNFRAPLHYGANINIDITFNVISHFPFLILYSWGLSLSKIIIFYPFFPTRHGYEIMHIQDLPFYNHFQGDV